MKVAVRSDGVALVTLDDAAAEPTVFTDAFASRLDAVVDQLRDDPRITGAVLWSGKPGSFVVGRDLEATRGIRLARDGERVARRFASRLMRLREVGKPIVAAVHGAAHGAGFELALACTGIVATDDPGTSVALPEVRLGLVPAANGLLRVADRAGLRIALELGLLGASVDSARAARLGLVDEVCPPALLLDVAAWRARTSSAASTRSPMTRLAVERNAIGRRMILGRARAALDGANTRHNPARARILEIVDCLARDGFSRAAALEAQVFGELVMSERSRTLVEVSLDGGSDVVDGAAAYAKRLRAPWVNEALFLVADGVSPEAIHRALIAWGWRDGPLPVELSAAHRNVRPSAISSEEIQMRGALRFVNEAIACLDEGVIRDPRGADAHAITAHGFPPFRGGPFRYVDAVGPAEVLRRLRAYESRFGARFRPAPALITRASTGQRFYPD